jgi:hypothetical protein
LWEAICVTGPNEKWDPRVREDDGLKANIPKTVVSTIGINDSCIPVVSANGRNDGCIPVVLAHAGTPFPCVEIALGVHR